MSNAVLKLYVQGESAMNRAMDSAVTRLKRFHRDRDGAEFVEYAVIAAVIAVVGFAVIKLFFMGEGDGKPTTASGGLSGVFQTIVQKLTDMFVD